MLNKRLPAQIYTQGKLDIKLFVKQLHFIPNISSKF